MKKILLILFLYMNQNLVIADTPILFEDSIYNERYNNILEEVRCLVCQNQSLADSNADLAKDLRNEIIAMLNNKKTDNEIYQFLVERYGDFVLYRPPLKNSTWFLWLGPFIFLGIAIVVVFVFISRQSSNKSDKEN